MTSETECGVLILKQGFLKKLPNQTKIGSSLKRSYRQWVTFGLTREQQPYLAFYTNEESVTTAAPLKAIPLGTCCHITKSLNIKGHTNVFTLTLADRQLSLMAPSSEQMDTWCRLLDTTLKSLGILKPDENLYTVPQWAQQEHNQTSVQTQPDTASQFQQDVSQQDVFHRLNVRLSLPSTPPLSSSSNNYNGSRDPTSPLPAAPTVPPRGQLPPLPTEFADCANNNTYLEPRSFLDLHENSMNEQQAEAASGETYEAVWSRPSDGGGSVAPPVVSSGSGAASPGAAGQQPPPIPHRNRINNAPAGPVETSLIARPRPRPRPRPGSKPPQQAQSNPVSGAGEPTATSETDYGVIWTPPVNNNVAPAGRGTQPQPQLQTQIQTPAYAQPQREKDVSSGVSLPNYTEHDENPTATPHHATTKLLQGFYTGSLLDPPLVSYTSPPYTSQSLPGATGGYSFSPAPIGQTAAPSSPLNVLPNKMMEAMGLSDSDHASPDPQVCGWEGPPLDDHGAPPPYMPRSMANRGPQKSLKQTQVDALEKEMNHQGGVKVTLRKIDCHLTIAWVDCFGSTWIAGWNQKARNFLHNAFHVGDQILSINSQVVENARMAHKLIKHSDDQAKISFILKRVPSARVFAIKRNEDGEDLGFRREGGTGEINDVIPFGVAARHGITGRAPTVDGRNLCNWFITEINMRPINLFFKDDEIEKRLNAVGKDISILMQPLDLINELKIQLKKNLKGNYKDFIVQ